MSRIYIAIGLILGEGFEPVVDSHVALPHLIQCGLGATAHEPQCFGRCVQRSGSQQRRNRYQRIFLGPLSSKGTMLLRCKRSLVCTGLIT